MCLSFFPMVLKKFGSKSKKEQEELTYFYQKKTFFSKLLPGNPDWLFDKLAEFPPLNIGWFFAYNIRKWWNEMFFFIQEDLQSFPLEMSNAVLTSLLKVLGQKMDSFSLKFWK